MREVAGVHERVPGTQELDRGREQPGIVRGLERLCCEADVIPHVLGRSPFAPGNLTAASAPVRIEAPEEADERHEPTLDHRNACVREALEDAVAEDRDE